MSQSTADRLTSDVQALTPELIALRRDFHAHPELAFEETRTSDIVARHLHQSGLEVQTGVGKTGVVALLRGEADSTTTKTLAIRADMDALPIQEMNEVAYRSQATGKMHACGHDGHTAIAVMVADILSKHRAELKGTVKFIFQPAEEVAGGASAMMKAGIMDGVAGVIGLHLSSGLPAGRVAVTRGASMSAANHYTLTVKGKGGHAASPAQTVDPVMISVHIIDALYSLMSRASSVSDPIVISIGSIHAGSAYNIIPETATIRGTLRTFSLERQRAILQRIQEIATGIAAALQGSCEVEIHEGCPPCINNATMAELVEQAALVAVGDERLDRYMERKVAPSDDMGFLLQAAPGCYFNVGTGNKEKETDYPHHHPRFNIDEDALPVGVEVLARTALTFLG